MQITMFMQSSCSLISVILLENDELPRLDHDNNNVTNSEMH